MRYPYKQPNGKFGRASIGNLPAETDFIVDSQDTQSVKDYLGPIAAEYDSFFVIVDNGDYSAVWGMFNIVPWLYKSVYRIK